MPVLRFSQERQIERRYIAPRQADPKCLHREFHPCLRDELVTSLRRLAPCWPPGRRLQQCPGRLALWAISRQPYTPIVAFPGRNGAERCAVPRAPRPTPLLHPAP